MKKVLGILLATTATTALGVAATAEPYHHGVASSPAAPSAFGRVAPDFSGRLNRMFPIGDSPMRMIDQNGYVMLDEEGKVLTATRHMVPQQGTVPALRALGTIEVGDNCKPPQNANFLVDEGGEGQDSLIPAGITFLGQMIDHDLTLDVISSLTQRADPAGITNVRNANLDMDFLYGGGPEATPHLYKAKNTMLVLDNERPLGGGQYDLYRTSADNTVALIGDPRNDENLAVSQLQAAFIAVHNKMMEEAAFHTVEEILRASFSFIKTGARQETIAMSDQANDSRATEAAEAKEKMINNFRDSIIECQRSDVDSLMHNEQAIDLISSSDVPGIVDILRKKCPGKESINLLSPAERTENFEYVRNHVTHYYHQVILDEFLPHIIGHDRVDEMVREGRRFFFPNGFQTDEGGISEPNLPVEFTAAAYRFGHSQVRESYVLHGSERRKLFDPFAGQASDLEREMSAEKFCENKSRTSMFGFAPICEQDRIEWNNFFTDTGENAVTNETTICGVTNCARLTDARLTKALFNLPFVNDEASGKGESNCRRPNPEESLAARNLNRGRVFRLPSGEDILSYLNDTGLAGAKQYCSGTRVEGGGCIGLTDTIDIELGSLEGGPEKDRLTAIRQLLEKKDTPLWLYILIEAEFTRVQKNGDGRIERAQWMPIPDEEDGDAATSPATKYVTMVDGEGHRYRIPSDAKGGQVLGDVGGLIVGEVILGLLDHYREQTSAGLDFVPTLPDDITPNATEGGMTMLNLIDYAYSKGK